MLYAKREGDVMISPQESVTPIQHFGKCCERCVLNATFNPEDFKQKYRCCCNSRALSDTLESVLNIRFYGE